MLHFHILYLIKKKTVYLKISPKSKIPNFALVIPLSHRYQLRIPRWPAPGVSCNVWGTLAKGTPFAKAWKSFTYGRHSLPKIETAALRQIAEQRESGGSQANCARSRTS